MATTTIPRTPEKKKESGWSRGWRYWKWLWAAITGSIRFIVVWLLFQKFTSPFETVVIASLVLIYQGVNSSFAFSNRHLLEQATGMRGGLIAILKKMGEPEADEAEEAWKESIEELKKTNIQWYIGLVFTFGIYFLALWKLLSVILASSTS